MHLLFQSKSFLFYWHSGLKGKSEVKRPPFQEQQVHSVLIEAFEYNFNEIFTFWIRNTYLRFPSSFFFQILEGAKVFFFTCFFKCWLIWKVLTFSKQKTKKETKICHIFIVQMWKSSVNKIKYERLVTLRRDISSKFLNPFSKWQVSHWLPKKRLIFC